MCEIEEAVLFVCTYEKLVFHVNREYAVFIYEIYVSMYEYMNKNDKPFMLSSSMYDIYLQMYLWIHE
jgi:hypothetical protein